MRAGAGEGGGCRRILCKGIRSSSYVILEKCFLFLLLLLFSEIKLSIATLIELKRECLRQRWLDRNEKRCCERDSSHFSLFFVPMAL